MPLVRKEALSRGLPLEVADAVAHVESGYNSEAVGRDGERGIMQVMPGTAAMLGFKGTPDQLADPATNIRLGVIYLAGAWRRANGDLCRALMKYRAGHNEERISPLSVEYCRRARAHLASLGSSLGEGLLPAVTLPIEPKVRTAAPVHAPAVPEVKVQRIGGRLVRAMPVRTAETSRRFWRSHTARIQAIRAKLASTAPRKVARAL